MKNFFRLMLVGGFALQALATVQSKVVPMGPNAPDAIELKNDSFVDTGSSVYLQQGFESGEKAGIWVQVPVGISKFKVDSFRVLLSGSSNPVQIFFQMGVSAIPGASTPNDVENAAQVTPGPFWNDIPAEGALRGNLCANGGEYVGAAIEFTYDGLPSVCRDADGINPRLNTLYAKNGGWNYSAAYGLTGDWVLRVVGHEATAAECP